jgi:hypothetical protein
MHKLPTSNESLKEASLKNVLGVAPKDGWYFIKIMTEEKKMVQRRH